jgi:hypothetical protein
MSSMIERVARAIWRQSTGPAHWDDWDLFAPNAWGRRRTMAQARAAIEAMRDPTEAMTFAAFEFLPGSWEHADISRAWNAGIDEALKEPT